MSTGEMSASPSAAHAPLALHVTLRWRDDVIAFRSLAGDATASVGAGEDAIAPIPREDLPEANLAFARVSRGAAFAIAGPDSAVTVRRASGAYEIFEGPAEVPLAAGDTVDLRLGAFRVEAAAAGVEALPRGRRRSAGAWAGIAFATFAHAVAFGLAVQDAMASSADDREDERAADMRALMAEAEQRARAADPPVQDGLGAGEAQKENGKAGDGRKGGGEKAAGQEGKMGDRLAHGGRQRRYAVPEQVKKDPAPAVARAEALTDAATFGMIGVLAQGPHTPAANFGDHESHGNDALAARGNLWARQIGESAGEGGLGLTGIGEGGGGHGEGIGLGSIGLLGHTFGRPGPGAGGDGSEGLVRGGSWSSTIGLRHRTHTHRHVVYRCSLCGTGGSGRLPPEVVQRIVRQNFGRFRACYEQGLVKNPALQGRVTARFVIGRDGAVSNVANGGSDLPDESVVSCVVRAFYGLSFPQPEGGIVTVSYPIAFSNTI